MEYINQTHMITRVKQIYRTIMSNALVVVFFLLLTAQLLLGDGKQHIIDVFGAAGVVVLCVIAKCWVKKQREPPMVLIKMWGLLLVYMIIRSVFSEEVGYSIYTTVRYAEAFLIFYTFYSYSNKQTASVFLSATFIFGLISVVVASTLFVFHACNQQPLMNLLCWSYGHNHVADILIIVLPMTVLCFTAKPNRINAAALGLCLTALLFTAARGAWMLMIVFITFWVVKMERLRTTSRLFLIVAVVCITTFLLLTNSIAFYKTPLTTTIKNLLPQVFTKKLIFQSRTNYWYQASASIKDNPLLGSGPGTFIIQSKKYQAAPSEYSWFAHNFPLQILVENGIFGAIFTLVPLLFVLCTLYRKFLDQNRKIPHEHNEETLIFWGVTLSLVYSLIEYNLDYLVVWWFIWGALGIVSVQKTNETTKNKTLLGTIYYGAVGYILLFYIFTSAGTIVSLGKNEQNVFIVTPFNVDATIARANKANQPHGYLSANEIAVVRYFHRQNPEVNFALAEQSTRSSDLTTTTQLFQYSLKGDPQNIEYFKSAVNYYLLHNRQAEIGKAIETISTPLSTQAQELINDIGFEKEPLLSLYTQEVFDFSSASNTKSFYMAKLYYVLGFKLLRVAPEKTNALWELSITTYPELGYWYHELASLKFFILRDKQGAQNTINECHKYDRAWLHCRQIFPSFDNVPEPGGLFSDIQRMRD